MNVVEPQRVQASWTTKVTPGQREHTGLDKRRVSVGNQEAKGQENVIAAGHQERDGVGSGKKSIEAAKSEKQREREKVKREGREVGGREEGGRKRSIREKEREGGKEKV